MFKYQRAMPPGSGLAHEICMKLYLCSSQPRKSDFQLRRYGHAKGVEAGSSLYYNQTLMGKISGDATIERY